ncbi:MULTISPECIES: sulfurtransferase complex subunit TusB [Rahnella]|jgi:tRNA 2-thiouridine synthesizing protein B|uniref:Sulfur relay protein TusB/DsrH n=1 Tax=Rahnella sp. (strain Y9602) TaxID=2703885 RepID=A0A0H3F458_RAHSY|nr:MULTISPECIES: sulfurtransferase complex subunit TusB [Rahnella]AFE56586.1 sulfur transfer complex subunit TusB [Rahnella aquatilis HX2]AYA05315.1 sulfurtransferase complex subunit TusB [Rahnella aquatilis]ADW71950.1 sulfur relay protein TusB/DsrH [Rahnella aceris]AZP40616.1 sulfurtransferase complex subunit TusB [Rahnella aquatilis]AZP44958.1 sulfurtransferase complex subunit TusB [Rahnella aquatilis]
MLFTLANSPQHCDFSLLIHMIAQDDALLLMQDGVLAALDGSEACNLMSQHVQSIYVLSEDLAARGLVGQISHRITLIDYTGFVALTEKHTQQTAW